jgi:hypothetical protein
MEGQRHIYLYLLPFYVSVIYTVYSKEPLSYDNRLSVFWDISVSQYFAS